MNVRREDLVSRRAAAQQLGIHANTFDRWAAAAGLSRFKVRGDNRVFYLRSAIDTNYEPIIEITSETEQAPGSPIE